MTPPVLLPLPPAAKARAPTSSRKRTKSSFAAEPWNGEADLAARSRLLAQDPLAALSVHDDLRHWQGNPDLAGLRDEKELARLGEDERASWTKLWAEVAALRQKARASYTETEHKGQLSPKEREKSYPTQMAAGRAYVIDLASKQFDTFLRLEDEKGKVLSENDDISKDNQDSRVFFNPPATGSYRIVATSFEQRGTGAFTLTIREFAAKRK
jgi:hypothetical protein